MDEHLKRRLVGAAVLVVAAVVFVPMWLDQGGETPPQLSTGIPPKPSKPSKPPKPPEPPEPPEDPGARVSTLNGNATPATLTPAATAKPRSPEPVVKSPTELPAKSPARSKFAVQIGSFSKVDNARGLRDKLMAKGYTAFVKTSGSVARVYVGPQSSRAQADKVVTKLQADFKLKGFVVSLPG